MAGTVTVTEREVNGIKKVTFAWTSSAGGAADGVSTKRYTGEIKRLVTVPAAAGSAPTDNYDLVVNDDDGTDCLMGGGANRDTANTEQVLASSLGIVLNSLLTLAVTNAGDTKGGTVIVYIK